MVDGPRMRCLFCTTAYGDDDVERVKNDAGDDTKLVYHCRVCESEREVSVTTTANVYGPEIAKRSPRAAARILRDQARRLEG